MAEARACRPWWTKKRWHAAFALWLLLGYPLSAGPAVYCVDHWSLTGDLYDAAYKPVWRLLSLWPPLLDHYIEYLGWWSDLARGDEPEE